MRSIRRTCDCEHEYQDKTYGKKVRVMNPTKKEGMFRCTVCLQLKPGKEGK